MFSYIHLSLNSSQDFEREQSLNLATPCNLRAGSFTFSALVPLFQSCLFLINSPVCSQRFTIADASNTNKTNQTSRHELNIGAVASGRQSSSTPLIVHTGILARGVRSGTCISKCNFNYTACASNYCKIHIS